MKPKWWDRFFQRVCEIPDRSSPDDEPDAIVATERELLNAYLGTIEELSDETEEVTVSMPLQLTPEMLRAVREDDSTRVEDLNEWHQRLGWLICAYDVLVAVRTKTPNE